MNIPKIFTDGLILTLAFFTLMLIDKGMLIKSTYGLKPQQNWRIDKKGGCGKVTKEAKRCKV